VAKESRLSIVVTSYTTQRLKDICQLLDSIKVQTYPNVETIFVGERSEELVGRVRAYAIETGVSNLSVLFNDSELGISASRNLGIKEAKGDIVGFVDDDVILCPEWAEEMVKTYQNERVIGVTGPALPLWQEKSAPWFPEEFYWIISCTAWCDWKEVREVRNAWGHGMSFKREAFQYCQFFDTFGRTDGANEAGKRGPVGDDTEFCINLRNKSGKAIMYNPKAKLYHKVYSYRLAPRFIRRQAYWQGYAKAMFNKIYSSSGEKVLETEHRLLGRILLRLFPDMMAQFFGHPVLAWKRLCLTISVLLHLTIGYCSATLPGLGALTRKAYSSP
jgi:GT2 family glycosyltransferase